MRNSLLRSFRKTVKVLSSSSQAGVDNVAKTLSFGQWRVPFEWLLDRDAEAFDANSQRTCMISPSLAKDLELSECKVERSANGELTVHASWRNPLRQDPCPPPHCTPSTIPERSTIVIGEDASEVRDVARRRPAFQRPSPPVEGLLGDAQELWTNESLLSTGPQVPPSASVVPSFFQDEANNKHRVVRTIERFGFAVVEDPSLQSSEGASSAPTVVQNRCDAAERMITSIFSFIRNSHYGAMSTWSDNNAWKDLVVGDGIVRTQGDGRYRESPAHLDGAYQSSLLDLHTDCTYFVECPKLQAFGCILTTPSTVGGATTLSDGAAAAMQLCKEFPEYFELLTQVPVGGRYKKEGWWYEGFRPVVSLSPNGRRIERIAFNNSDRIPLDLSISCDEMRLFYRAYYAFHRLVQQNAIEFVLRPGQLLFFDNHRLLHGRLTFAGPRVMCGAYIGTDEYLSALRSAFAHVAP